MGIWVPPPFHPSSLLQPDYQFPNLIQVLERGFCVNPEKSHLNSNHWATSKAGSPWWLPSLSKSSHPQLSMKTTPSVSYRIWGLNDETGQRAYTGSAPSVLKFWSKFPSVGFAIFKSRSTGNLRRSKDVLCREKRSILTKCGVQFQGFQGPRGKTFHSLPSTPQTNG